MSHIAFKNPAGHLFQLAVIQFKVGQFRKICFRFFFRQLNAAGFRQGYQFIGILSLHGLHEHFFCDLFVVNRHNTYPFQIKISLEQNILYTLRENRKESILLSFCQRHGTHLPPMVVITALVPGNERFKLMGR